MCLPLLLCLVSVTHLGCDTGAITTMQMHARDTVETDRLTDPQELFEHLSRPHIAQNLIGTIANAAVSHPKRGERSELSVDQIDRVSGHNILSEGR